VLCCAVLCTLPAVSSSQQSAVSSQSVCAARPPAGRLTFPADNVVSADCLTPNIRRPDPGMQTRAFCSRMFGADVRLCPSFVRTWTRLSRRCFVRCCHNPDVAPTVCVHVHIGLPVCDAVWTCGYIQTFRRNILPPSSGLKRDRIPFSELTHCYDETNRSLLH
jgi:hypothetical protein